LTKPTLRLRVFAGPNGSGKSTIIKAVRASKVQGIPVDFGTYINADDIAQRLRKGSFSFKRYNVSVTKREFNQIAIQSGLLGKQFPVSIFKKSFTISGVKLALTKEDKDERLAQIIADYLRKKLLSENRKFSFETVFSHGSKLEIMQQAKDAGYKVYLYFVSTEDPKINKYRIKKVRVAEGGHDVPEDKIEKRYYRSLDYLYEAAQLTYQTYFFDNSQDGKGFQLFAHFKSVKGSKKWGDIDKSIVPRWFVKYYSKKVK